MSRRGPHLLRVEQAAPEFEPLVAAARELGLRSGWLDLERPPQPPPDLLAATASGLLRAAAVGERGSLAWKARSGPAVLRDLLREHFAGCALVLVRGALAGPSLARAGEEWEVTAVSGERRRFTTLQLAERLRRPRLL